MKQKNLLLLSIYKSIRDNKLIIKHSYKNKYMYTKMFIEDGTDVTEIIGDYIGFTIRKGYIVTGKLYSLRYYIESFYIDRFKKEGEKGILGEKVKKYLYKEFEKTLKELISTK